MAGILSIALTSKTFSPAKVGCSEDTRTLGLIVRSFAFLGEEESFALDAVTMAPMAIGDNASRNSTDSPTVDTSENLQSVAHSDDALAGQRVVGMAKQAGFLSVEDRLVEFSAGGEPL